MLPVGSRAPEFSLSDQAGAVCKLSELLSFGPIVLFFYPKDETAICTKEACGFRDSHQRFLDLGAQVFGISRDSIDSHASFARNHSLPFRLLSDTGGKVAAAYGVKKVLGLTPGRATCVVDESGIVRLSFSSALSAQAHIAQALSVVESLA